MCIALALLRCELVSLGMLLETRISRTGSNSVFSTFGMGQMHLAEHVTRCLTRLFPGHHSLITGNLARSPIPPNPCMRIKVLGDVGMRLVPGDCFGGAASSLSETFTIQRKGTAVAGTPQPPCSANESLCWCSLHEIIRRASTHTPMCWRAPA